jgi:dTDP-4-amino-4,6-dideoxygalactose transaminase
MRPPLQLDIGWTDLAFAGLWSLTAKDREDRLARVESLWSENAFACLSVRTGFDSFLEAIALPEGSEVLVSAYTIPDMVRVLEHHGLRPVPVDIELDTLAPSVESLRAATTERTRIILVAHLFGSLVNLDSIAEFAKDNGLLLFEDGAQVFGAHEYRGHPQADLSLFSFGTIKTATALGGALLNVRDDSIRSAVKAMRSAQAEWPRSTFTRKVLKASMMKLLSYEPTYSLCVGLCRLLGANHEDKLHRSARGFHGDLISAIRHAPNAPLLALIERRLATYSHARIGARARIARDAIAHLPDSIRPVGQDSPEHTHWVLAVASNDPKRLVEHLRATGFDATQAATVTTISTAEAIPQNCKWLRESLVYVPSSPDFSALTQARLACALSSFEAPPT